MSHVYGFGGLILLSCSYYPKQFKDSMQFLLKFQWIFFRYRKSIQQLTRNLRAPQIGKAILERTAKLEASDFRTYHKGIGTKSVDLAKYVCLVAQSS